MIPPNILSISEQQNIDKITINVTTNKTLINKKHVFPDVVTQWFLHLSVELDSQDGVGVGVVADFSSLLEMTDLEFPRSLEADDGHQTAGEQTLHDAHILRVHWQGHTHKHAKTSLSGI